MTDRKAIIDEYTDLPISRQKKYVLRHPERVKEYDRQYHQTPGYKVRSRHKYHKRIDRAFDSCVLCSKQDMICIFCDKPLKRGEIGGYGTKMIFEDTKGYRVPQYKRDEKGYYHTGCDVSLWWYKGEPYHE